MVTVAGTGVRAARWEDETREVPGGSEASPANGSLRPRILCHQGGSRPGGHRMCREEGARKWLCSEQGLGVDWWALEQGDLGGLAERSLSGAVVLVRASLDRGGIQERRGGGAGVGKGSREVGGEGGGRGENSRKTTGERNWGWGAGVRAGSNT